MQPIYSIILPAKNEAKALQTLRQSLQKFESTAEIIVVDDGSADNTATIAHSFDVKVISHPYSLGNGAAIKTGSRMAKGEILIFMDADGQHNPADIPRLLGKLEQGYDMTIGARNFSSQANFGRGLANSFYNWFASMMTGHKIADLTSGFRAVRADKFRQFLYLLPNGFSYPTTITMAFFRAGYPIAYVPIKAAKRQGKSHIRPVRDGIRFLLIIFKIATLYSPLKLFVPVSFSFFCIGLGYYLYSYLTIGRFTNMSALLFSASVIIFLIGLISEQITALNYRDSDR